MTETRARVFEGQSGQIFRYLLDHGPATATEIAQQLGVKQPGHVLMAMARNQDVFVKLQRVRSNGRPAAWMWSVWEE